MTFACADVPMTGSTYCGPAAMSQTSVSVLATVTPGATSNASTMLMSAGIRMSGPPSASRRVFYGGADTLSRTGASSIVPTIVRFGLIGYGLWGKHHAGAIVAAPGATLGAIACASEATAAAATKDFPDVPVDVGYDRLLARADIDAVAVVV